MEKVWDIVAPTGEKDPQTRRTAATAVVEGDLINGEAAQQEAECLQVTLSEEEAAVAVEKEERGRTILLSKVTDVILMRVKNFSPLEIWAYLVNHYAILTTSKISAIESAIKATKFYVGDNLDDVLAQLQEHWGALQGSSIGYFEARKLISLCDWFDDQVFSLSLPFE